jgi:hypothetical protein
MNNQSIRKFFHRKTQPPTPDSDPPPQVLDIEIPIQTRSGDPDIEIADGIIQLFLYLASSHQTSAQRLLSERSPPRDLPLVKKVRLGA